eukprot:4636359-Pleurochrysis_carterae.AAC.2
MRPRRNEVASVHAETKWRVSTQKRMRACARTRSCARPEASFHCGEKKAPTDGRQDAPAPSTRASLSASCHGEASAQRRHACMEHRLSHCRVPKLQFGNAIVRLSAPLPVRAHWLAVRARARAHTHAHTHTHAQARARARVRARARARARVRARARHSTASHVRASPEPDGAPPRLVSDARRRRRARAPAQSLLWPIALLASTTLRPPSPLPSPLRHPPHLPPPGACPPAPAAAPSHFQTLHGRRNISKCRRRRNSFLPPPL